MLIQLLQRHYLFVFILLSGLCGLALGQLGSTAIGLWAAPPLSIQQALPAQAQKAALRLSLDAYNVILNRDIFNSAGGQQSFTPATAQPQTKPSTVQSRADSKWTLIGTVSGGTGALATLNDGKETAAYRLNAELPDGSTLVVIERNRVVLEAPDGSRQTIETVQGERLTAVSRRPPAPTGTAKPSYRVENLDENSWLIPAQAAEHARTNIGDLLQQAQAVPYLEGNQTTGFQIRMIQPGSLIAQLGLKKGDILREVNGLPLNSPEKALQVFGQLRQATRISIGLERRGKAMTFAYEIR